MKMRMNNLWGKPKKGEIKKMKKIATTGLIGGKAKGLKIPK